MAIKVIQVENGSLAEEVGIKANDFIVKINGNHIYDFLDINYFSAEEELVIEIINEGHLLTKHLEKSIEAPLGVLTEEHRCRECTNNCIFCFVDQMPSGMRESLYIKDDDYAYSFIYGNYITLTNLSEEIIDKIIKMKITPLYVSVHATNPQLRKEMMGYKQDCDVLSRLRKLAKGGIEYHTQLVLVPGYNDGEQLERSLRELTNPELNTIGIGVVPVGITKHRGHLKKLPMFTPGLATKVLDTVDKFKANFENIYASDEFFIQADREIPESSYYGSYDEIENGIGMVRMFLDNWDYDKEVFADYIKDEVKQDLLFVTGESAYGFISKIVEELDHLIAPLRARTVKIKNYFMGETVTVCGLLTFQDINKQMQLRTNEIPVFSGDIFNSEGITLDNYSQDKIIEELDRNILITNPLFEGWEIKTKGK